MRVLILFFSVLMTFHAFGGGMTYDVITVNGKKGLKDADGNIVISPAYDEIGWSDGTSIPSSGVIGYQQSGAWGLINVRDERLTVAKYTHLLPFKDQTYIASIKGEFSYTAFYGVISEKGKPIIDFKYYTLKAVNGYLAALSKPRHQLVYGLLDAQGQVILDFKHKTIQRVSDHVVKAELDNGLLFLFNTTSRQPLEGSFTAITPLEEQYSLLYKERLVGLLHHAGQVVVPPAYESIKREGKDWKGKELTKWEVLSTSNEVINEISCQKLTFIGDHLIVGTLVGQELLDQDFTKETSTPYDQILDISGSKLLFKNNDQYGIYDLDTKRHLEKLKFDTAYVSGQFIYGAKYFQNKLEWALYDTFGVKRTHFDYQQINTYQGGLFAVKKRGHWGFMDRVGKEVISCVYDQVGEFVEGLTVVKYHGQYGVINKKNEWIVLPQKDEIQLVNTRLYLSKNNKTTKLQSIEGELVYFTDNPIQLRGDALVESLANGQQQIVTLQGVFVGHRQATSTTYEGMKYLNDKFIAVKINGKYGFVDRQHRLRITNRYEDVGRYSDHGTPVKLLGKWGMINAQEEIIVQPTYDAISQAVGGVSIVTIDSHKGLINQEGKELITPQFDEITQLESGEYLVNTDGKYGLVSQSGKQLINAKYDELIRLDNKIVIVKKRNQYGTLTLHGVNAIPSIYDQIYYHQEWQLYFAKKEGAWKSIQL